MKNILNLLGNESLLDGFPSSFVIDMRAVEMLIIITVEADFYRPLPLK